MRRTFTREELLDNLGLPDAAGKSDCGRTVISNIITHVSRWSVHHEMVFRLDEQPAGEAWRVRYRVGATEIQDEGPWEHEKTVEATLVREVEKLVKVWEPAS